MADDDEFLKFQAEIGELEADTNTNSRKRPRTPPPPQPPERVPTIYRPPQRHKEGPTTARSVDAQPTPTVLPEPVAPAPAVYAAPVLATQQQQQQQQQPDEDNAFQHLPPAPSVLSTDIHTRLPPPLPAQAAYWRPTAVDEGEGKGKHVRTAAGFVWEDKTLGDWSEDDFRIFCGDLGNEVNDDMLGHAFRKYASFLKAKVIRDKRTQKSKGFGFVSLSDPRDGVRALQEMNGKYVGNRPIKLRKSTWKDREGTEKLAKKIPKQRHRPEKQKPLY